MSRNNQFLIPSSQPNPLFARPANDRDIMVIWVVVVDHSSSFIIGFSLPHHNINISQKTQDKIGCICCWRAKMGITKCLIENMEFSQFPLQYLGLFEIFCGLLWSICRGLIPTKIKLFKSCIHIQRSKIKSSPKSW